jgi:peroxiredoxin
MKHHRIATLIFSTVALCLGLEACIKKMPRQGDKAPVLELLDLEGKTFSTQSVEAKLFLLHFWTDWCKACREEFPKLELAYRELKPKGVEFVAVNIGQPKATSQKFKEEFSITFPMLVDQDSKAADIYKVTSYPTNYLIDQKGVVLRRIVGWMDKTQIEILLQTLETPQNL